MPHAATVSRYLGQEFAKATTRTRGWRHFTSGYAVRSRPDGTVRVEYQRGDTAWTQTEESGERTSAKKLREYTEYLEKRYSVELVSPEGVNWRQDYLVVSDKLPGPVTEIPAGPAAGMTRPENTEEQ
jgi:hypothetical protein